MASASANPAAPPPYQEDGEEQPSDAMGTSSAAAAAGGLVKAAVRKLEAALAAGALPSEEAAVAGWQSKCRVARMILEQMQHLAESRMCGVLCGQCGSSWCAGWCDAVTSTQHAAPPKANRGKEVANKDSVVMDGAAAFE